MQTNFQKIKKIIESSDLVAEDKEDLIFLFSLSKDKDDDIAPVVQLCSEEPDWIRVVNDNYKAKHVALTTQNSYLWNKIIEQEEKQLKDFKV